MTKSFREIELKLSSEYIYAHKVGVKISEKDKFAWKYCHFFIIKSRMPLQVMI